MQKRGEPCAADKLLPEFGPQRLVIVDDGEGSEAVVEEIEQVMQANGFNHVALEADAYPVWPSDFGSGYYTKLHEASLSAAIFHFSFWLEPGISREMAL